MVNAGVELTRWAERRAENDSAADTGFGVLGF